MFHHVILIVVTRLLYSGPNPLILEVRMWILIAMWLKLLDKLV